MTVTGKTLGENLKELKENGFYERCEKWLRKFNERYGISITRQDIIRPADKAIGTDGSIAVLRGNLAPEGAVLTVLPMANLASPLVVAARIPEVPEKFHDACVPYEEKFPILYDLIITSNDLIMPVDAAVVHPTGVYLYCPNKNVDRRKAEKFLNEMLVGWKLDGNAKVMNEEKKFLRRLSELKTVTEEEDDGSAPHVLKLLKSLSM